MTTELTKAAQQALEALKHGVAQLNGIGIPLEADPLHTAITALERALTQRPAAQTEREAFEGFVRRQPGFAAHLLYRRNFPGSERIGQYVSMEIEFAWEAWQARASLPAPQQATPEPLIVKGAMAGMVDAQVRDLWPTKGATPEPVGEPVGTVECYQIRGEDVVLGYLARPLPVGTKLFTRPAPGVPEAWDEGYRQGVEDERTSEANIGIAGFGAKGSPARQNPYRAAAQAKGVV